MEKVDRYISDLLFRYDCVVVPGLGAFIGNYKPARIDHVRHRFFPPSKNIVFNSNIKDNDGLLIKHMASSNEIPYQEASGYVTDFAIRCMATLNSGNSVNLENIGILRMGAEYKIHFHPENSVNYLTGSYGLTTFVSPAIKRSGLQARTHKKFIDRKPYPAGAKVLSSPAKVALVLIPVLIAALFFLLNPNVPTKINRIYSGISGLFISDSPVGNEGPSEKNISSKETDTPENKMDKPTDTIIRSNPSKTVVQHPVKDEGNPSAPNPEGEQYYIIGGAFRYYENAMELTEKIRQAGYEGEYTGKNKYGLHLVSWGKYPQKNTAIRHLRTIREKHNPSAWLLKK